MCWVPKSWRVRSGSAVLAALFAFAFGFSASPAFAGTLTNWSVQPKGTVTSSLPVVATGTGASDGSPLVSSSLVLKVDGITIPRSSYTASVSTSRVYVYYVPNPALADGPHTYRIEVKDTANKQSAYQWSATLAQPPSAGWLAPAAGQTVYHGWPAITMSLADNTPSTTFTVTGQVRAGSSAGTVVQTFGGTGLAGGANTFTLENELPFGTYTLTATVTDAAGNTRTLTGTTGRSFTTVSLPAMTILEACGSCHADMKTSHPTPASVDCGTCHPDKVDDHMEGTEYCEDCHWDGWHAQGARLTVAVSRPCFECHNQDRPDIPRHTAASAAAAHEASCAGCHYTSVIGRHAATPAGSAYAYQCDVCHNSTDGEVVTAIAAGTTTCSACHGATAHTDVELTHTATSAASLACAASDCHQTASATTVHADRPEGACAVCHNNPTSGDLTAGKNSKDCEGCHPDRLDPHGYEPADHEASESCIGSCHAAASGLTQLVPVHESASGSGIACSSCHSVLVPGFAELYPAGWDNTCTACHPISDLHATAETSHTGTDVAYQAASFFGNGCSDSTGHTGQSACHDISNIAVVHSRMPQNGCPACHGEGKTPSQECFTCHKPGYANTYTVPGTPSANIVQVNYPSSDASITPGWTWTTTPAGQPIYSVVNSPYPPATTTRFVTITSTTAGGVKFGWTRGTPIPDNARITDVRIYAKGRATNTTYPRRMQGVFKIGGQDYPSANLSSNLTTLWTSGAGVGFHSPSTRLDWTREPLYGEMIWRNPKTGQDWTPAEINGTDPDSSLEGFGVNLTGSAAANNVSLCQVYLKVTYYTVGESVTNPTVGTHIYHGDNVKYLHDPSDVPDGQRFVAVQPAHGWYDALYYQDCYDFCHRGNGGEPVYSANQGQWMWFSVGGDPTDPVVSTRTLTLRPITIPTSSPTLTFDTQYRFGSSGAGYVEISTDGGGSWTTLTGTVGGSSMSSVSGNASGWVAASYDLTAYAGQSAKLRFRYENGTSTGAGWAFDSLSVSGSGGPVFADDAETLKPDWTSRYWTRSQGAFAYQ